MEEISKEKETKKKMLPTLLLILILLIAVVGISYTAYNWAFTGSANTISTNDISLEFLESNSNIINITNALPMGCIEGKQQAQTFDFAVTSKTTKDVNIKYTLNIEKLEVDSGYTQLQDDQIALYLTDYAGTNELLPSNYRCATSYGSTQNSNSVDEYKNIKPMLLANPKPDHISLVSQLNNYKLYSRTHLHDSSHNVVQDKFKLRVWIAGNVDASSWNASTKLQYKFKIGITSEETQTNYVYRYGEDRVLTYQNLTAGTYNGYCAIYANEGYNSCTDDKSGFPTQSDCESYINGWEGANCSQGTWTVSHNISYTTDAITLNNQFYLRYNIGSQTEVLESYVCYILNDNEYCLKGGDGVYDSNTDTMTSQSYESNKQILNDSFGASNCSVVSDKESLPYYSCLSDLLSAKVYTDGKVYFDINGRDCQIDAYGDSNCHIMDSI